MKHFERAYVGVAAVTDAAAHNTNLGFMIPSTSNRDTVNSWATGRSGKGEPKFFEFDNVPIDGFTFGKHVTRYHTSNKKMRIEDPRGFWLEISIENVAEILRNTKLDHGTIETKMVWMRNGSENWLVPEDDQRYKQVQGAKPSTSYDEGDLIIKSSNEEYVYVGKRYAVIVMSGISFSIDGKFNLFLRAEAIKKNGKIEQCHLYQSSHEVNNGDFTFNKIHIHRTRSKIPSLGIKVKNHGLYGENNCPFWVYGHSEPDDFTGKHIWGIGKENDLFSDYTHIISGTVSNYSTKKVMLFDNASDAETFLGTIEEKFKNAEEDAFELFYSMIPKTSYRGYVGSFDKAIDHIKAEITRLESEYNQRRVWWGYYDLKRYIQAYLHVGDVFTKTVIPDMDTIFYHKNHVKQFTS